MGARRHVLILTAVVLLAGCTSPGSLSPATTVEPELGDVPVITTPEQISMPIYEFMPSVDQTVAIMFRSQDLVNDCLAAAGSSLQVLIEDMHGDVYHLTPATTASVTQYVTLERNDDKVRNALWGFFDTSSVATNGYDRPADSPRIASTNGGDDPDAVSCLARVGAITPGGIAMEPFDFGLLPDGGPPLPSGDSRFVDAEAQWSSCLAAKGFTYATPIEAEGYLQTVQIDTITAKTADDQAKVATEESTEKALAVADVQCKLQTNLVGIGVAVQSAYEQRYIDTHRDQLKALQVQISDFLSGKVAVPDAVPSSAQPSSGQS